LSSVIVLRCGHDLRSRLTVRVRDRTPRMAVICLVLGMPPVLDVVALVIFALHDLMNDALGAYSRS
jgi:hypothetical protein